MNASECFKKLLAAFGILFFILSVESSTANASTAGFYFKDNLQSTGISFETWDNLVVLKALINEKYSVNLILDTGISSIILFSKSTFKSYYDSYHREIPVAGLGTGSPPKGILTLNNRIDINGIRGDGIGIVLMNDAHALPRNILKKIDGIIGYQLFSRFVVKINFKESVLELNEPACFAPKQNDIAIPLSVEMTRPYLNVSVNGSSDEYFLLDTGCSFAVLQFQNGGVKKRDTKPIGIGLNGRIYGTKRKNISFSSGKYDFKNQEVIRVADTKSGKYRSSGTVGSGFLRQFDSVTIDYFGGMLYLGKKGTELFISASSILKDL
ncbi:MAG: hypothetical protein AAF363_03400 [Bacteroidota bacterium]